MYDNVTMSDYKGYHGFGIGIPGFGHMSEEELRKALVMGYQHPPTDGGGVHRVQSLESVMRITTHTQEHIKLWKKIPRMPAYSTVEEFNIQSSYGHTRAGAFLKEAEAPQEQDAAYERKTLLIKYLGTQRSVSHQSTLVKTAHGQAITIETQNGAIWLLQQLNRACYFGDSSIIQEAFDGIYTQINNDTRARTRNIMDLRGGVLKPENVEEMCEIITSSFGVPTDMLLANRAHSDLSKQYYAMQRVGLPVSPQQGTGGFKLGVLQTNAGDIPLETDIFLRSGDPAAEEKLSPTSASSPRSPLAPTLAIAAVAAAAGSKWEAGDVGNWRYVVTALNRFGESARSNEVVGALAAAGDAFDLTITDGGGADGATGYKIWRTKTVNGITLTEEAMIEVPRAPLIAASVVFRDLNDDLPGTSKAFLLNMNIQLIAWKQLAPMMKIALSTNGPHIRWMQLIYGALACYQRRKLGAFKNIADA